MKRWVSVAALALAAALVSSALGAPPPGKGKPPASGHGCKPAVAVLLHGTLAGNGAAAPFTLSFTATSSNRFGRAYVKATQPLSIGVTTDTAVDRQGDRSSADLKAGDRATIQARTCKADLAQGATPTLVATRITAHPGT